ncbi:MAG: hypothetical protein Q8K64_08350 [Sediminibacterium sp.]|nr:hypothetical protein [Sediminibacterium sp.]
MMSLYKKNINIIFLLVIIYACNDKKNVNYNLELEIINNNFTSIVDTFPFQYHTLIPAPNDVTYTTRDTVTINLYSKLLPLNKWRDILFLDSNYFKGDEEYFKLYTTLLGFTDSVNLEIEKIKEIGLYKLINQTQKIQSKQILVGSVIFSRICINESANKAIMLVQLNDNSKGEVTKLVLLKKVKEKWVKYKEIKIAIA